MGIPAEQLGHHGQEAIRKELAKEGKKRLDSNLEARFATLLKRLGVSKWERDQRIPCLSTRHEADFLWSKPIVALTGGGALSQYLAIFIDGPVHGLRGRLGDTLRCVNLCQMLPSDVTVFRFTEDQLELGAMIVKLWNKGDGLEIVRLLKRGKP